MTNPDDFTAGCIEAYAPLQFGADPFMVTNAEGVFAEHIHTYEYLLSTVSADGS
jgi:hypothetical protein